MMIVEFFAECCTARILEGFGGHHTTRNELRFELIECCEEMNDYENGDLDDEKYNDLRNLGLIFATTTTSQTVANEFLKEVGFHRTRGAAKGRHPETKLYGWYICSSSLYKWYKKNR